MRWGGGCTGGDDSVAGRMLADATDGGYGLAALRVDVANMTGRYGPIDRNASVAQGLRETMRRLRPDAWLLAEHNHDAAADLDGSGWHATMNYAGFARPMWSWLRRLDREVPSFGDPGELPVRSGAAVVAAARAHQAQVPFSVAVQNMVLLGSHDTARWTFTSGTVDRNLVGVATMCGWPGTPSIFAGDEIGLGPDGSWDVTAREPFPWHDESSWNLELLAGYRELIGLRRANPALARGGLRFVSVGDDHLVWLRESREQCVLVHVARAAHRPLSIDTAALGYRGFAPLGGADITDGAELVLAADGPSWRMLELTP